MRLRAIYNKHRRRIRQRLRRTWHQKQVEISRDSSAAVLRVEIKRSRDGAPVAHIEWASAKAPPMQRATYRLLGLLFLIIAPWAIAQDGGAQPCPAMAPDAMGCQLVAWSHLQEPVPLPESKPAAPDQQPGQSPDAQTQQASRQRMTGIIVRQGEKFVLKAGDNTPYQLDDQERARRYQDKQVLVVGRLDTETNTFHIESIELAS
jgi:hypothetical protein